MLKRFFWLTLVLLLFVSAAPIALANSECDGSYSHYARGVQLHDMGDYTRALRHYECALERDPDNAIIPQLIAILHEDVANSPLAWSRDANSLADLVCDRELNHTLLGKEAYLRGETDRALIHLQCALTHDAQDLDALYMMGEIYISRGDTHTARHYFNRVEAARTAESATPTPVPDASESAGFVMPDWLTPYEMMLPAPEDTHCKLDRIDAAGVVYQPANTPFHKVIAVDLGDACSEINWDESVRVADVAADEVAPAPEMPVSPAQATFQEGMRLREDNKLFGAANSFIHALAIDPAHKQARCQLGMIFNEWSYYGGALSHFNRILADDPQDRCARENLRRTHLSMLAMYPPLTVDDFFYHARTYLRLEMWEEARDAFGEGLQRDPTRNDVRCELGKLYVELGDDTAALRAFDQVLLHNNEDSCALSNRRELLRRQRER